MERKNSLTETQLKFVKNLVRKANCRINKLKEKDLLEFSDSYNELKNYVKDHTRSWDTGYLNRDDVLVLSTTTHRLTDKEIMEKISRINKFILSQDSHYKVCEYKAAYKRELNIEGELDI